jgi:hypothetical protein
MQRRQRRCLRKLPGDRVLAPAGSDDEDPHRPSLVSDQREEASSLDSMDDTSVAAWLDRYTTAWRSYDPAEIAALFAEDAVYRFHPWDEGADCVRGRDAIVASWLEAPDEPGSWVAEYRPWAVDSDRAVALGTSRYLATDDAPEAVFHNVFLLRFDDAGLCVEFTDVYMRRPA